jgi:ADP-ribose pyrophosphatase YjhB (NUDIX family)
MGILAEWRYCPRCRAQLGHRRDRVVCDACGFVQFANSAPAVAALVVDGEGRVLLARRAIEPYTGLWDTVGGFLDEAEEPIAGLHREVLEETGLEIDIGHFAGAFVDRYGHAEDASPVLNLVWEASVVRGEPRPADDVTELRWFARDELPADGEIAFRHFGPFLRAWAQGR